MRKHRTLVVFTAVLAAAACVAGSASASPVPPPSAAGATGYAPSVSPDIIPLTSGWHCDQGTCIDVFGTGLNVTGLDANGYVDAESGCTYPWWYDYDGALSQFGPTVCWNQGAGFVYSYKPVSARLPDGDKVCVVWLGANSPDGNPCIDIHS